MIMDNNIGSLTAQTGAAQMGDAVNITVLKKAIDIQAQAAAQLIEALPKASSNPSHLGQSIDLHV